VTDGDGDADHPRLPPGDAGTEHGRIRWLARRLRGPGDAPRPGVEVDVGDDAVVLDPPAAGERLVATVDTAIEGVHFRAHWASPETLGRRAAVGAASDLAAMGARPQALLLAFAGPRELEDRTVLAYAQGVATAGDELGAPLVGGNLSRASEVSLTLTALGHLAGPPFRRDGGRPGDALWLSGPPGSAAVGLAILLARDAAADRGVPPPAAAEADAFVERWRRPRGTFAVAARARGVARGGIDLSDGLLPDLAHLASASGVDAVLEVGALPRDPGHDATCDALGLDPLVPLLAGGESYALLLAVGDDVDLGDAGMTRIGHLEAGAGGVLRVVDAAGRPVPIPREALGFDHFREHPPTSAPSR